MTLFDDIIRQSLEPALHNQNAYDYYCSSGRNDISKIREVLNEWFTHYPENEKKELKNRFKKNFNSAFYELFLFSLFRIQGFDITIHPVLSGTLKKPDFLLSKDDFEFYLEAKVVNDKSHQEEAFERKRNEFYDSLSKTKISNFHLGIDSLVFNSSKQPRTKALIKEIEAKANELDPEEITVLINEKGYDYIPRISYRDNDIDIVITFIPVKEEFRNKIISRPLGMFPVETWWGGSEESIRQAIIDKAKRYGKLDKPYFIAINALTTKVTSTTDVDDAVLGSIALSWTENPGIRDEKWVRQKDGIFLDSKGARLQNLTGIFITKVYPHNIHLAPYWFYEHPFSLNKTHLDKLGLQYSTLQENSYVGSQFNDFGKILGIDENWLNES